MSFLCVGSEKCRRGERKNGVLSKVKGSRKTVGEREGKTKNKKKTSIGVTKRGSVVKGSVNRMPWWGGEEEKGWRGGYGARRSPLIRCKVLKGGTSGGTGSPWQPIGVGPIIAKTERAE